LKCIQVVKFSLDSAYPSHLLSTIKCTLNISHRFQLTLIRRTNGLKEYGHSAQNGAGRRTALAQPQLSREQAEPLWPVEGRGRPQAPPAPPPTSGAAGGRLREEEELRRRPCPGLAPGWCWLREPGPDTALR